MKYFLFSTLLLISYQILAQSSGRSTYCNPMDIDYKYNFEQLNEKISYRSGADPVIVNHKGEYYLFVTISGGWWHSKDLLHWNFVVPDKWPMEDMCAPAALSVRDTLYLFQSTFVQRPIFYTTTPENGKLHFYNRWLPILPKDIGPWDPSIFYDEAPDKWYMYWGSSNVYPLFGAELDKSKKLAYKDKADFREMIRLHPDRHGWERFGRDHRDTIRPFTEGAWMTKFKNKYYLQYGAPGTEYNVYANGTYVGDHPLGPFTYAPYNPISYKPGGFVTGAGHGNTFQDNFGNYWNTGTPWIAVNWNFERRIAMFPAGFDQDGQLFSNTRFGDFPHYLPTRQWTNKDELFTGWMLLSYKKPCTTSSVSPHPRLHQGFGGQARPHSMNGEGGIGGAFTPSLVTDENPRTFWVAQTNHAGEWLTVDLLQTMDIRAIQINFTDYQSTIFNSDSTVYTQFKVSSSLDNKTWETIADLSGERKDRPNAYIELDKSKKARYVRYEHGYVAATNLAISDIRIFGKGTGKSPKTPDGLTASRDTDPRNAFLAWKKVPGAVGYNILWGIQKDKLYQTYQLFADQDPHLELRALTIGQDYYFAIEAFNENGVSAIGDIVHIN